MSALTSLSALRRKKHEVLIGDDHLLASMAATDDPELEFLKTRYRAAFKTAFETAIASLSTRERVILRLQIIDGLSIDGIGSIYGVHRATAARWLARARRQILTATRREMRNTLDIDSGQLDSIMRLIDSRLEVSIERVLAQDSSSEPPPK